MCVFAHQNFLKDPPFGKMDFVSCRNVLIYMDAYLQKKALTTFHYALNPTGFLLLGKSETISSVTDLFAVAEKTEKVFSRKNVPARFMPIASQRSEQNMGLPHAKTSPDIMHADYKKIADDLILSQYTPAGVIVNEGLDIVDFRGITTPYLEQGPGKPSHNVLLMAKPGLGFELRNLLHKSKKTKSPIRKENIPIQLNGHLSAVAIEVIPLPNTIDAYYLILFHTANSQVLKSGTIVNKRGTHLADEKDQLIYQLERELAQVREDMRNITQDQEAINEELQSANEELLSGNEELQSLNEELETSKEEQQSANEALTMVNQEIIALNEQVTTTRDYAEAIIANMREPLLVLDKSLRIKTANNAFYKTFRVNESETENVLVYDIGNKQWDIPELRTLLENILPEKSTFTDFEITHTFTAIGKRSMLLNAREIITQNSLEKLILLSIEDSTVEINLRNQERLVQKQLQFIADAMPEKVWTADVAGNANYFNQCWLTYTGLTFDDLKDWGWERIIHPDDRVETQKSWQHSVYTGTDFELQHRFLNADGAYKWHFSRSIAQKDEQGVIRMWIGTNTEIHEQKTQHDVLEKAVVSRTFELQEANETLGERNEELQHMNKELEAFAYVSSHDLQEPLRKIQTFAGRILEEENQHLTDNGKSYLQRLQLAAARMQQLIQDLLAFSRVNTAERNVELTDLSALVGDVLSEIEEAIADKQAIIDVSELGTASVSVFQFRQLMHNLIGNALKFSNPAISPHIRIKSQLVKGSELPYTTLLPEKTYCHITITDNGIGFDAQYRDRIFDVFQRLHSQEQYNGTGIGLAIAKKIVENHNGIIMATSELNKGAQFDIYIPVI
ncbi:ATP-binding protein [Spirosoma telluris]|uniref:ATP-binding protein n=1 Tax=Spirosoma telluris TaxID=2183553 RepID=UPI002FC3CFEF